jgi:hypothetical protein
MSNVVDMNNQIVPLDQWGPMAEVFKDDTSDVSHFTAGLAQSWPMLTCRGKVWRVRFRGEEKQVTEPDPNAGGAVLPARSLEVVIVESALRTSKAWYQKEYTGEHVPPDCWSADAITPDLGAPMKQSETCVGCRHNVMRVKENGRRGKECADGKRLAIVSINDIPSQQYGGPLMLKVPPGSFQNYVKCMKALEAKRCKPFAALVRLSFDHEAEYPCIVFTPIRPLTAAEGAQVLELRDNPIVETMLNDKSSAAFADPDLDDGTVVETLPPADAPAPPGWEGKPKPTPPTPPTTKAEPKPEPKVEPETLPPGITPKMWATFPEETKAAMRAAMPKPEPKKPQINLPPGMTQAMFDALPATTQAAMYAAQLAEHVGPGALTPEELVAKANAKAAAPAKNKGGRPRSKAVSPPPVQTVTPAGNGTEERKPDPLGNNIADRVLKAKTGFKTS